MLARLLLVLMLSLSVSCVDGSLSGITGKNKKDSKTDEEDLDFDDETDQDKIEVPTEVAGAFLVGCQRSAEDDRDDKAAFGCAVMTEKGDKRTDVVVEFPELTLYDKDGAAMDASHEPSPDSLKWHELAFIKLDLAKKVAFVKAKLVIDGEEISTQVPKSGYLPSHGVAPSTKPPELYPDELELYMSFDNTCAPHNDTIDTSAAEVEGPGTECSPDGRYGQAGVFSDSNRGYVITDDPEIIETWESSLTISLWIKFTDTSNADGSKAVLLEGWDFDGSNPADNHPLALYICNDEASCGNRPEVHQTGKDGPIMGAEPVNDGKWHHLAVVRDDDEIWLYVDGEQVSHAHVANNNQTFNGSPMTIGHRSNNRAQFKGMMDEIKIWDIVLTPEEIVQLSK